MNGNTTELPLLVSKLAEVAKKAGEACELSSSILNSMNRLSEDTPTPMTAMDKPAPTVGGEKHSGAVGVTMTLENRIDNIAYCLNDTLDYLNGCRVKLNRLV